MIDNNTMCKMARQVFNKYLQIPLKEKPSIVLEFTNRGSWSCIDLWIHVSDNACEHYQVPLYHTHWTEEKMQEKVDAMLSVMDEIIEQRKQ